jgi:ABC-type molybdate transport system substrate-binding protein
MGDYTKQICWKGIMRFFSPLRILATALLFAMAMLSPVSVVSAAEIVVFAAESKSSSAPRLLEFLASPAVRAIFEKRGSTVLADTDA